MQSGVHIDFQCGICHLAGGQRWQSGCCCCCCCSQAQHRARPACSGLPECEAQSEGTPQRFSDAGEDCMAALRDSCWARWGRAGAREAASWLTRRGLAVFPQSY